MWKLCFRHNLRFLHRFTYKNRSLEVHVCTKCDGLYTTKVRQAVP